MGRWRVSEHHDLPAIARSQRWLILTILVILGLYTVVLAAAPVLSRAGASSGTIGGVVLLALAGSLIAQLVGLALVLVLARALGTGPTTRILMALGMFLPLVSMLILLSLNGRATKSLRTAGLRVGLLGANPQDVQGVRPRA